MYTYTLINYYESLKLCLAAQNYTNYIDTIDHKSIETHWKHGFLSYLFKSFVVIFALFCQQILLISHKFIKTMFNKQTKFYLLSGVDMQSFNSRHKLYIV